MRHTNFPYVKRLVAEGMYPILRGPAGSGKTTAALQVAEELGYRFFSMSMTKQTTLSHIVGFKSLNGEYIGTLFREAFENGGLMLLDEIDAADPNVILALNTIENGFMTFPDKIVHVHEDFRLIASANPANEHSTYTGRSKLDFSTEDRFIEVEMDRDPLLETALTSEDTIIVVDAARKLLESNGISAPVTMRDALRYHRLRTKELHEEPHHILVKRYKELLPSLSQVVEKVNLASRDISTATSVSDLIELAKNKAKKGTL